MSEQLKLIKEFACGAGVIRILQGDLTLAATDAIVNAANSYLKHGGGVAAAIVRRGGPEIQKESDAIGFVPEGHVAVTGAGKLAAQYVIHAVGPRGEDPEGDKKLESAAYNALRAAQERNLKSISFPAISTGIFGFPKQRAAEILLATAKRFLQENPTGTLQQIDFVLFDDETTEIFAQTLEKLPTS